MRNFLFIIPVLGIVSMTYSCKKTDSTTPQQSTETAGLKIAYINGDSILLNYEEFRKESAAMEIKQRRAEEQLQSKGAALEKEFNAYQQKAQTGTMTGKEMEAREKYLTTRQEAILAERDQMAKEIMDETGAINNRLQKVLQGKLEEIKKQEGYDFILSYIQGGPILIADEKFDITDRVLKELNAGGASGITTPDTTSKK